MRYFLDDEEITLEELLKMPDKWNMYDGFYTNVIVLDTVVDDKMYFIRGQFYDE